jgi:DNA-binding beta-propeller fold protein YncE
MARSLPILAAAAAGATVILAPATLRRDPAEKDAFYIIGELCSADDNEGVPDGDFAARLASLADHGHTPLQSRGDAWQVPFTTEFDPKTAKVGFDLSAVTGDHIVAGEEVRARVTVTDSKSGLPVSGRSVAGWMMLERNAQVSAELPCSAKAKLFTQGRVTARPDVDLNTSRMLVLNRDGTVAIVNPQVDFTITQMEGVIPLPGVPADWAKSDDGQTVYVSLPVYGAVAVIDARAFQITGLIELPKGSVPTELLPLPGGAVAVYLSALGSVTVARPDGNGQTDPVAVGAGPVAMVRDGSGSLYVASSDGRLLRLDAATGRRIAKAAIDRGEPTLAWSPRNRTVYATTRSATRVVAYEPAKLMRRVEIGTEPGTFTLAVEPSGRHLVALNRDADRMTLIDTRSGATVAQARTPPQPVEITFSQDYAYVRGLAGDHFTAVELAELAEGRIAPIDIQSAAGPVRAHEALSRATMIAPYGHGALVGNADEAVAYYYMEGMNSPMGTVKTYGKNVQGLMTIDRGFREVSPGIYETTARLPFGGTYDVPVAVDADGFVACFSASAAAAPRAATSAGRVTLRVEPVEDAGLVARHPGTIVIRLLDDATGKPTDGLQDVRLLAFSSGGTWQARKWAKDLGDGRYAGDWTFPKPGRYGLSLEVASLGMGFADQSPLYLKVGEALPPAPGTKEVTP